MKSKWALGLACLAVAAFTTHVWAFCDEHDKAAQPAKAADASKTAPCSGHDAKAVEASKTAPCSGHDAKAVSADGTKPCCKSKAAMTAAATESQKPCSGAATASADGSKPCCGKPKGCSSSKTWLSVEGPSKAVLSSLPTMRYRVGDETLDCPMEAEKMALKADKPVQFVVADKTYNTKPEATVALTALLDAAATDLQAVHLNVSGKEVGCPHAATAMAKEANTSIKYTVGGVEFSDKEKAEKVAKLAADAAGTVKISYKVGEESFCCERMAGMKAKETGKSITFVVAGEETCCETTAKMLLAQAKVRAILEAAANGNA